MGLLHRLGVRCEMCFCESFLKYQVVGEPTSFTINCPNCNSVMRGTLVCNVDENDRVQSIEIVDPLNLIEFIIDMNKSYDVYSFHISSEFLTRLPDKSYYQPMSSNDGKCVSTNLSPFMSYISFFKDNSFLYDDFRFKLVKLSDFFINKLPKVNILFELFWSNRIDILSNHLQSDIHRLRRRYNNAGMYFDNNSMFFTYTALNHQMFAYGGLLNIDSNNRINSFVTKFKSKMFMQKSVSPLHDILEYIIDSDIDISELERKGMALIADFADLYSALFPIIPLYISNNLHNVNRSSYGITTLTFDDICDLYARLYEYVITTIGLFNIPINNILYRGDFDLSSKFKPTKPNERFKSSNINGQKKLDELVDSELFSINRSYMDTNIRNSISHYDYSYDGVSQVISFTNDKNKSVNTIEMSLLDFCELTMNLFIEVILIINQMFWVNRQRYMEDLASSMTYTRNDHGSLIKTNSISRNSPCSCGSGLKYKKCCGK